MNRKYLFISFFITFISLISFPSDGNKLNTFKTILDKTNGKVVECGFKETFNTKDNGETLCQEILKTINEDNSSKTDSTLIKSKNLYTIDFTKDKTNGYIESFNDGESNIITIYFISDCNLDDLNSIRNKIQKIYKNIAQESKISIYVKAELRNNSIDNAKTETENILKKYGASNINIVKLDNGYSLVANSNRFAPIKSNGVFIDLNCAFCSYLNGDNENKNYIFIGTPVLIASY